MSPGAVRLTVAAELARRCTGSARRAWLNAARREAAALFAWVPPPPPSNVGPMRPGNRRSAVCRPCGRVSRLVGVHPCGQPIAAQLSGWVVEYYAPDHAHPDGSAGAVYTCPHCYSVRRSHGSLFGGLLDV